jgi:hypothetical protein
MFEILEYILKESELPEIQQQLLATWGSNDSLKRDIRFKSLNVYNFWVLLDGSLISNGKEHQSMCGDAGVNYLSLLDSGAIRAVIQEKGEELDIQFKKEMTESQISKLRFLFGKHTIHTVFGEGLKGDFSATINSKDKLDYVLRYGSDKED